ncbi:MAG TPA: M20/M25/M40 family metallo-hydrolase [Gemmatimonadales bacterium]|nr:M20/M25/M40 family metallo-hydrolase [Gemmatimonadales bacterium]
MPLAALRRPLLLVPFALLAAGSASAQSRQPPPERVAREVSSAALQAHLGFLADDALEGRRTGTHGAAVAARYIAAQFQRLGLQPAGDSGTYFHRIPLVVRRPDPILRASGEAAGALRWLDDYVLVPRLADSVADVSGEVVFAGYGIVAPNRGWDDYKQTDVRGKVVLVLPGDPDSTIFDRRMGRPWSSVREKVEVAARRGAAGLLVLHGAGAPPWDAVRALGDERLGLVYDDGLAYWGWIRDSAAAPLVAAGGRSLPELAAAAAWRDFTPVTLPFRLDATLRATVSPVSAVNVLAKLPGRGPHAGESVLLGAHYDHEGIGPPEDGDSIYNGAEDNASGTAAVLGAAEAFARSGVRPERTVVFAAFVAEEEGLLGSEALVLAPPEAMGRVVGMVNGDYLNLYGRTRDIGTVGNELSSLGATLEVAARAESLTVRVDPDDVRRARFFRSDNYPFARAGIPAVRIVNGVDYVGRPPEWGREQRERYWTERYHQPDDELAEWMSVDGLVQQARVAARILMRLADAPAAPAWAASADFAPASPREEASR